MKYLHRGVVRILVVATAAGVAISGISAYQSAKSVPSEHDLKIEAIDAYCHNPKPRIDQEIQMMLKGMDPPSCAMVDGMDFRTARDSRVVSSILDAGKGLLAFVVSIWGVALVVGWVIDGFRRRT